ncbi:unnamed protein product, partial [marine sediment metagenome]
DIEKIGELARKIEWQNGGHCPICKVFTTHGHDEFCEIGQILSLLPPPCEAGGIVIKLGEQLSDSVEQQLLADADEKSGKPTLIVPKVFIDDTEEFKKKVNLYFKTDMDKYPDEPLIESEKLLLKAVSLLPPPCERCGGSGRIPVEVRYISCAGGLDTKSKTLIPCPKCQAPAGKVEKFVLCKRCGNKTILATSLQYLHWA